MKKFNTQKLNYIDAPGDDMSKFEKKSETHSSESLMFKISLDNEENDNLPELKEKFNLFLPKSYSMPLVNINSLVYTSKPKLTKSKAFYKKN